MPPQPRFLPLVPVTPDELRRIPDLPVAKEWKTTFPKRALASAADARAALKRWHETQPEPAAPRNPDVRIKAVRPTKAALSKLRAVAESDIAPAEMLKQTMNVDALFGTLYSALATYEFMKTEAEYKRAKASGRNLPEIEARWQEVVQAFQTSFAAAGLRGIREVDLTSFVGELTSSRANLDTIVRIANNAVALGDPVRVTAADKVLASFVPTVEKIIDPGGGAGAAAAYIANLCAKPMAQGSFTKHFSYAVSLSVKIKYPCGVSCSSWKFWEDCSVKYCTKTVTLAGVSVDIGVNVGYKVDCCGATAWGQAYSQVCATIVGIQVCAGCSATIVGVAGVSRTPVASGCSYGLGINAILKCTLGGQTILYVSYPFGWTVTGPCPPAGLCP